MNVWVVLAYQVIRRAVKRVVKSDALWTWVEALVEAAEEQAGLSGKEKRLWVEQRLESLPESIRTALSGLAGWLLNFAIEAMVARLKISAGRSGADDDGAAQ